VVCLAPRALEDSVRPQPLSDVVVRPLNFTVRQHVDSGSRNRGGFAASSRRRCTR